MVSIQRHVALLRSALREGEIERAWIRVERVRMAHLGALLLTDRRLMFSGLSFVTQSQEGWPLAVLESAAVTRGDGAATLTLRLGGVTETFTGRARDLEPFAALLGTVPQQVETPDASVADAIERLAALHEAGALTAAEFTAAKRRLLE